jgi:hypothetical protein
MTTLRISFLWEEDDAMTYDDLVEQLIHLGADSIEDEEVEPLAPPPTAGKRKKK